MPLDTQEIRTEPHTEIGYLLEHNVGAVLDRWSQQAAKEQPNGKRVHRAILLDHLGDVLKKLARSLAESDEVSASQHCLAALTHGEQRWEEGWSLTEVVRDYQILRLVVLEFFEENLDRPLKYREVLAIGLALDEAISASIVTYVKGRDDHIRQLEERRAEEARQVQQELEKQAAALQDADKRKNEFLAMLAHELRNPLAPIRNAAQIQLLKQTSDPELQWANRVIERQVHQMTRMVEDLLDVTRITEGKVALQKESVDLSAVVGRAIEMVRPLIDDKKQQLTTTLPSNAIWLEADSTRLVQVFANLLTNACKYTDERGHISVSLERQGSEAVIRIRDTGIGIPVDFLPRVFEPFVQEHRSLDRAQGGLGIGLALVRSLVEMHSGSVQALSDGRGQGSEFIVSLPISVETLSSPAKTAEVANRSHAPSCRVLVVDDNKDSTDSLAILLRLMGHDVETANNGLAALEAARANAPDVILLDLGLPGLDGFQVAHHLRANTSLSNTILVAMTGYGQDEIRRRTLEAGFNGYLVKPVDLAELQTLLQKVTSTSQNN
jgi:signal transduction histidine kinase/ActR/RegA family two-component response regulator